MTEKSPLARLLGTDEAAVRNVEPLLEDAASALSEVTVPGEAEIHELVAGAYRFNEKGAMESEDTDRRLGDALKNVSRWRESAQVYLNGATVLLRRSASGLGRFEAKKRVLAALRARTPSRASECFYFTRETGVEAPGELAGKAGRPIAAAPAKGPSLFEHASTVALVKASPESLTHEQLLALLGLLSIPADPRSPHPGAVLAQLARGGDRTALAVFDVLCRPDEVARSAGGEPGELLIGIRRLFPRLGAKQGERILRAALEAGWTEWVDRPLRDAPLDASTRQRLLAEFGSRQEPRGNPYRPAEPWFYSLDPS